MAELLYGPWMDKEDEILLTPEQFKESQQQLLEPIIEAQHSLLLAARPFVNAGNVRPVHCRKALNALEDISANVSVFCRLLSETDSLPIFISSFRYPLLINLHRLREQITHATVLIDACRTSYTAIASRASQKQHDIYAAIEYILSDLQHFLTQLGFFETEIQFQEKRLVISPQEQETYLHFSDCVEVHARRNVHLLSAKDKT